MSNMWTVSGMSEEHVPSCPTSVSSSPFVEREIAGQTVHNNNNTIPTPFSLPVKPTPMRYPAKVLEALDDFLMLKKMTRGVMFAKRVPPEAGRPARVPAQPRRSTGQFCPKFEILDTVTTFHEQMEVVRPRHTRRPTPPRWTRDEAKKYRIIPCEKPILSRSEQVELEMLRSAKRNGALHEFLHTRKQPLEAEEGLELPAPIRREKPTFVKPQSTLEVAPRVACHLVIAGDHVFVSLQVSEYVVVPQTMGPLLKGSLAVSALAASYAFRGLCLSLTSVVKKLPEQAADVAQAVSDATGEVLSMFNKAIRIAGSAVAAYLIYKFLGIAIGPLLSFFLPDDDSQNINTAVEAAIAVDEGKPNLSTPQVDIKCLSVDMGAVTSLFADVFGVVTLGSSLKFLMSPKEWAKGCPKITGARSAPELVEYIGKTITFAVNRVMSVFGVGFRLAWDKTMERAIRLQEDVTTICNKCYDHNFATLQVTKNRLLELKQAVAREQTMGVHSPVVMRALDHCQRSILKVISDHNLNLDTQNGNRTEPVSIMLAGGTNVGKTTALDLCGAELGRLLHPEGSAETYNYANAVYAKPEGPFYSGYFGQPVFMFDDFLQKLSKTGDDSDAVMFMSLQNCWSLQLNMADLSEKGKTFFKSKVILLSTNAENMTSIIKDKVLSVPAFMRRINYSYTLRCVPEYQDARGLYNRDLHLQARMANLDNHGFDPLGAWEVCAVDVEDGISFPNGQQWVPLRSLVAAVVARVRAKEANEMAWSDCKSKMTISHINALNDAAPPLPGVQQRAVLNPFSKPSVPQTLVPVHVPQRPMQEDEIPRAGPVPTPDPEEDLVDELSYADILETYAQNHLSTEEESLWSVHFLETCLAALQAKRIDINSFPDKLAAKLSPIRKVYVKQGRWAYPEPRHEDMLFRVMGGWAELGKTESEREFRAMCVLDRLWPASAVEWLCDNRQLSWDIDLVAAMPPVAYAKYLCCARRQVMPIRPCQYQRKASLFRRTMGLLGRKIRRKKSEPEPSAPVDTTAEELKMAMATEYTRIRGFLQRIWAWIKVNPGLTGFIATFVPCLVIMAGKAIQVFSKAAVTPFGFGYRGTKKERKKAARQERAETQSACPDLAFITMDAVTKGVRKLVFHLYGGETNDMGQMLMVSGSLAIMPKHTMEQILAMPSEAIEKVRMWKPHSEPVVMSIDVLKGMLTKVKQVGLSDSVVFDTKFAQASKDLVKHFVTTEDVKKLQASNAFESNSVMVPTMREKDLVIHEGKMFSTSGPVMTDSTYFARLGVDFSMALNYSINSRNGDCGAPIVLSSLPSVMNRRILGTHSFGNGQDRGGGTLFTREQLEAAILSLGVPKIEDPLADTVAQSGGFMPGGHHVLGTSKPVALPCVTKLMPGLLQADPLPEAPQSKTPAHLRSYHYEGKKLVPDEIFLEKLNKEKVWMDDAELEMALNVAMEPFFSATRDVKPRVPLPLRVAVEGLGSLRRINGSTSVGYPLMTENVTRKMLLFDVNKQGMLETSDVKLEAMKPVFDEEEALLARGGRLPCVYVDMPKDELRSFEKVSKGATRYVSVCPLNYLLHTRRHYGSFMDAFCSTVLRNDTTIGINPLSSQWGALVNKLTLDGDEPMHVVSGDFSGYDTSQGPQVLDAIQRKIEEWYQGGAGKMERASLWREISHSRHLGRSGPLVNVVYQWESGLPSGNPMTTIINSIYTLTLIAHCWGQTFGFNKESFQMYRATVRCVANGDDSLISVHPRIAPLFNQHTIAEAMANIGFTFTCELSDKQEKGSAVAATRPLRDVCFLKRGFRKEAGMWVAPLAMSTVLQKLYWRKPDTDIIADVEETFAELSLHGEDVFLRWGTQIKQRTDKAGVISVMPLLNHKYMVGVALSMKKEWFL